MLDLVDASLFLGMHSSDETIRILCKNFFVDRFDCSLGMSDDQTGYCDRIIWTYSRELQDIYYPFMDRLRTDMDIQGLEYTQNDLDVAQNLNVQTHLKLSQKLTLGMAIARQSKLYTIDTELHDAKTGCTQDQPIPVFKPSSDTEKLFPDEIIETCYQDSLALKIELCVK